jgi:hypothetical protein
LIETALLTAAVGEAIVFIERKSNRLSQKAKEMDEAQKASDADFRYEG